MSQRAMILSAFLAALVLVVIGGVVANLTEPEPAADVARSEPASTEPAPAASPTPDPDSAALDEREAEYRRLIEEANRRLTEQQRALDAARQRVAEAEAARPTLAPAVAYFDDDDDGYEHEEHEHHERGERWERDDD